MNPHEPWRSRQNPHLTVTRTYPPLHGGSILDRLSEPSILVPLLVLFATAVYHSAPNIRRRLPQLAQFLWDTIVTVLPARLLYAFYDLLYPPLFPVPMPPAAQSASHAAKSEVLRKILGIDTSSYGGGIMASMSNAGRRFSGFGSGFNPASSFTFGKGDIGQPAGLGNISNSCYQNSILQGLASLKPLPEYLRGIPVTASTDDPLEEGEDAETGAASAHGMRTAGTLRELIADLNDASNNGRTLWTPAILKNMSTWQQQDAQEYFSKLLDEVDRDIGRAAKSLHRSPGLEGDAATTSSSTADDGTAASQHSDDSGYHSLSTALSRSAADLRTLRNPLEGLIAQRVACVSCGWSEGLSMIPFNCITLSLGMDRNVHDLYERLDAYTKVEPISGVECGKCTLLKAQRLINLLIAHSRASGDDGVPEAFARIREIDAALEEDDFDDKTIKRCKITQKVNSTKTKQAVIARAPQSLVVHMNRSVFDESTGQMFKNLAAVRFPMILDLGPWCLGSAGGLAPTANHVEDHYGAEDNAADEMEGQDSTAKDEEQWLLDPTASMVAGDSQPSKITGPIYELRAVVTHYGRHENGHYVCYRKHPRQKPKQQPPSADSVQSEQTDAATGADADVDARPPNLASENHDEGVDTKSDADSATPATINTTEEDKTTLPETTKETPVATQSSAEAEEPEEERDQEEAEEESQWWRLSDQNVTKVTEESVLSQGGVFMLFYDCVDPVPVLASDQAEAAADAQHDPNSRSLSLSGPGHVATTAAEEPPLSSTTDAVPEEENEPPLSPTLTLVDDSVEYDDDSSESLLRQALSTPLPSDDGGDSCFDFEQQEPDDTTPSKATPSLILEEQQQHPDLHDGKHAQAAAAVTTDSSGPIRLGSA